MQSCSLHALPYEYFCERCAQPVCKQCMLIGPHNTQIHLITNISIAYQRRIHQVKNRIARLLHTQAQQIQSLIRNHSQEIEEINCLKEEIIFQNKVLLNSTVNGLRQTASLNANSISQAKEELIMKINEINDLGYIFESITSNVETIASHSRIVQEMKEAGDRLKAILQSNPETIELPKRLSTMRLKLTEIEAYEELFNQKTELISRILNKTSQDLKATKKPVIDYGRHLEELNVHMASIEHNVCHFCGAPFDFQLANTSCASNNSLIKLGQFNGYCRVKPDIGKWGTTRHFFGVPQNQMPFYRQAKGSFKVHLNSLLFKFQTICLVENINLRKLIDSHKNRQNRCERISLTYILVEIVKLTEREAGIIISLCEDQESKLLDGQKIFDMLERKLI